MSDPTQPPQWWFMANALVGEYARVLAWTKRHDPDTGIRFSWLEAMWHTAENSPGFDHLWDEAFEMGPDGGGHEVLCLECLGDTDPSGCPACGGTGWVEAKPNAAAA